MMCTEYRSQMEAAEALSKLHQRIAQLETALVEIRDKAVTMKSGGAWAAGLATLSLSTGPMAKY